MTAHTSMLHIRVDDDIKTQAVKALDAMGLSMSEAVRIFLKRIVTDQAFPIELKVPNAETRLAMEESKNMMNASHARFSNPEMLFDDLEKNSSK
jgi:DNA-damage-inducible protein J